MLATLYRSLLKAGRLLDEDSTARCLLIAQPDEWYDHRLGALVKGGQMGDDKARQRFNSLLFEFNGGEYYRPRGQSVRAMVRQHFRSGTAAGLRDTHDTGAAAADVAFAALRGLNHANATGLKLARGAAARRRRAELRGIAAADLPPPVPPLLLLPVVTRDIVGCAVRPADFLLTHPMSYLTSPSLHRAVVLLLDVDQHSVGGIIINKPTHWSLDCLVDNPADRQRLDVLLDQPVYNGGDVKSDVLRVLHGRGDQLGNSARVADGLYVTDNVPAAVAMVSRPNLLPNTHRAPPHTPTGTFLLWVFTIAPLLGPLTLWAQYVMAVSIRPSSEGSETR